MTAATKKATKKSAKKSTTKKAATKAVQNDAWSRASTERPKPHVLNNHHEIPESWVVKIPNFDQSLQKMALISPTAHSNTHHLIDRFVRAGGPENVSKATLKTYTAHEREMALYAWQYRPDTPTITSLYNRGEHVLTGGHRVTDPRLGRVPEFDPRSISEYHVSRLLDESGFTKKQLAAGPRNKKWTADFTLDQGQTSMCVGNAHDHAYCTTPRRHSPDVDEADAAQVYHLAQDLDEYPGNNYEGTSTLGGAKAMTQMGRYKSYYWCKSIEDILLALSYHGPVVFGVNWYDQMFTPDPKTGLIVVSGGLAGGHDICGDGVDVTKERVRLHQSWGPGWGLNGWCWISFADLERIVITEGGDACVPLKPSVAKAA